MDFVLGRTKHQENLHKSVALRPSRNSSCSGDLPSGCTDRDMEIAKETQNTASYNTFNDASEAGVNYFSTKWSDYKSKNKGFEPKIDEKMRNMAI